MQIINCQPNHCTSSPSNQQNSQLRKLTINRIRSSLQALSIIGKQENLVRSRIDSKSSINSEETDQTTEEVQEIQSQFIGVGLFEQKYELFQKIGQGSNGIVFKCKKKRTGEELAAKSFTFEDEHLPALKANFLFLSRLKHPHIIKYEALYIDIKKHSGWLVMELVNYSSLLKTKLQEEEEVKDVIKKLLDTLKYLHQHDIVHRDIKPQNILYDPATKDLKLIDFGISRRCCRRGVHFDMWTITGTLFYRAPEMFSGSYREGVDVWATGIVLYKLICGHTPFESEYLNETIKNIVDSPLIFPPELDKYSPKMKTLLEKMLIRNPSQRISASKCLKHLWFSSIVSPLFNRRTMMNFRDEERDYHENQKNKSNCCKVDSRHHKSPSKQTTLELSKKLSLISIKPYVKCINGDEYHCIDSQVQEPVK